MHETVATLLPNNTPFGVCVCSGMQSEAAEYSLVFRQEPCKISQLWFMPLPPADLSENLFSPIMRLLGYHRLLHFACAGRQTTGLLLMSQPIS